jgi:L-fucose dehydrogenase
MDLALKDKLIVVTGGAAGIGEAIIRACLAEGARVVVLSRISDDAKPFMAEMESTKAPCALVEVNLEDTAQCKRAIDEILERHGDIYGLINSTGVNDSGGLEKGSVERFVGTIHKDLIHYYALAHYSLPALKRTQGTIVNVCFTAAHTGQGDTSGCAASNRAQLALTREWAAELLPYKIRVNAVLPAAELKHITDKVPPGRRVTLDSEIAAAAVFLLSPTQSSHTTGQHLIVDRGYDHLDRALD